MDVCRNKGTALVLLLAVAGVIAVLGTSMLTLGYQTRIRATRTAQDIAARVAADAGLTRAIHVLNAQFADRALDPEALPSEADAIIANFDGTFTYTVVIGPSSQYTITSTGSYQGAQRTVEAVLGAVPMTHDHALFGQSGLLVHSSARVDQYNSTPGDDPLSVGTNSTDPAAITLKSGSYIDGDLLVGVGGDPVVVIDNGGTYTGSAEAQTVNHPLPPVVVPDVLALGSNLGKIDGTRTIANSGRYAGIDLGNGQTLTIAGNVELYVTGNVVLGNEAEIRVDEGCSLALFVDGRIEGKEGSTFNNTTSDPMRLRILGTETCEEIILKNSGDMYAVVYAPRAAATIHNSATLWGSISADSCDLNTAGIVHYDASLQTRPDDLLLMLQMASWREY